MHEPGINARVGSRLSKKVVGSTYKDYSDRNIVQFFATAEIFSKLFILQISKCGRKLFNYYCKLQAESTTKIDHKVLAHWIFYEKNSIPYNTFLDA